MIAYNSKDLDSREILAEANRAAASNAITAAEHARIKETYTDNLYTPNIYIRIGFFILTVVIALCALGILLLGGAGNGNSIGGAVAFIGVCGFVMLEIFIYTRKMYRAGVDDALLWIGIAGIYIGIALFFDNINTKTLALMAVLLGTAGLMRYKDRVMGLAAYGSLIWLVVAVAMDGGAMIKDLLPFLVMAMSCGGYVLFTLLAGDRKLRHYHSSLAWLRAAALVSFYLACNYYVVREMNAILSAEKGGVALGWLWWTLTGGVPVAFIARGVQKKDVIFLWTGLAFVAAAVFTVRYYYHVLPAELAMIFGGVVLIVGAYWVIRFLEEPKAGLTSKAAGEPHVLADIPLEGVILAETFKPGAQGPGDSGVRFGGGSGGGGGAGGEY